MHICVCELARCRHGVGCAYAFIPGMHQQVCSTLRPTSLSHVELFELESICRFVADFVAFEPLENLVQSPAHLASPASVLAWQVQAEHSGMKAA